MSITKTEKVYLQLHEKIIKGIIRPGSRLVITQIAKEFNVSEIPVREVIQRLAQEGYISLQPHAAPTVTSLSEDEVRQIFEIRSSLEALAARLTVDHISNAQIRQLELLLEESKRICEKKDLEGYFQINRSFHESLYQYCNNQILIKSIRDYNDLSTRYPNYYQEKQTMELSIKEHEEILNGVRNRDSDLVEQLTKMHLLKVIPKITQIVRETN